MFWLFYNNFHIENPNCHLSTWEKFIDLYILPIIITLIGVLLYIFGPLLNKKVEPVALTNWFLVIIFFFIVYLIDRILDYWRYNLFICSK